MGSNERQRKKNRRDIILIVGLVAILALGFYIYQKSLTPTLVAEIGGQKFTLEIADTPYKQSRGLMFRKELLKSNGMIFINETERIISMWMKNTYIPLDMIFLDKDKKVIGILENVPPMTLDQRTIGKPSKYVIELNAGIVKQLGLKDGDVVRF